MDIVKLFADERHLKIIDVSKLKYSNLSNILLKSMNKPNVLLVLDHNVCDEFINECFNDIDPDFSNNLIRIFYKYDYLYFNKDIITIQKLNKWIDNISNNIQKVVCDVCYENFDNLHNCPTCLANYCKCCLLKSFKLFNSNKCSFCKEPLKIEAHNKYRRYR